MYTEPVYYALAGLDFTEVMVINPAHAKALKGHKTDLLTELRAGSGQVSGQAGIWVASVCRHGHWRRSTAGVVLSGGAAVRFA